MFVGLLRESEVMALKREEVWIHVQQNGERVLCVYLGGLQSFTPTKTDQGRQGELIVLAENRENRLLCPVAWYLRHEEMRHEHKSPFLIADFIQTHKMSKMSNELPNLVMKRWITRIGDDPKRFSSHSGRHGGATAAAEMEVAERLIRNMDDGRAYA